MSKSRKVNNPVKSSVNQKNKSKDRSASRSKTRFVFFGIFVISLIFAGYIVLKNMNTPKTTNLANSTNSGLNATIDTTVTQDEPSITSDSGSITSQNNLTPTLDKDKHGLTNNTLPKAPTKNTTKSLVGEEMETIMVKPTNAEISFVNNEYDYGTIKKNSDGNASFIFKNIGSEPLILKDAQASCGCTVPSWPKEPILPGMGGVINITYDTQRMGSFNKSITVISNAKNSIVTLIVKGNVVD